MDSFCVDNSIAVKVANDDASCYKLDWDDFHVVLNGPVYTFKLGSDMFYAREGVVFNETDENVLEADWDLTWICRDLADPKVDYYYEQGSLATAIHNFSTMMSGEEDM